MKSDQKTDNPLEVMSEKTVRAMVTAMGGDPDAELAAMERLKNLRPQLEKLRALAEHRDLIISVHLQEILQHACDLVAYLDEEFSVDLVRGILSTAVGFASSNPEKWKHYTEAHAPTVNQNIIDQESSRGELDS